jgi:hypothetical protein
MFRRSKAEPETETGRYRSETVQSTLSHPAKHGKKVEAALNEGTAKGWKVTHVTSMNWSTAVATILFWDTEPDA